MGESSVIQMRGKGTITLPIELRRKYGLNEGDVFTLIDLGEGTFVLAAQLSQVARSGDRVAQAMVEEGLSLEAMLGALDEEREKYYRERYAQG